MIVDDRLDTVLRTVAAGGAGIRTQYRQLADLLGRTVPARWGAGHDAALARLDALHDELGDEAGAGLLRACALRSPRLVQHFAGRGPRAALAAIAGARLGEADWLKMIPALPVQARGFLRHRRDLGPAVEALLDRLGIDDFVLPQPAAFVATAPARAAGMAERAAEPGSPPAVTPEAPLPTMAREAPLPTMAREAREGIGAIVRRIEAFRRNREARAAPASATPGVARTGGFEEAAPATPIVTAIDIRIDAEGTVCAAEPSFAGMLVGHRPFTGESDAPATCDAQTLRAVKAHLPIEAGLVTLEGAAPVAGSWRIDASPQFTREGGHFLGYHGRLRRPQLVTDSPAANDDDSHGGPHGESADRLRQLLHELRTPINAIQGFAELIQQQLFGPTPHQYRSLAASIASDAARMLAGFEEVERLVKLETGRGEAMHAAPGTGTDVVAMLARLVAQLDPVIGPREVKLRCTLPEAAMPVAVDEAELERTLWRMLSVIAGAAAPGERLSITLAAGAGFARLSLPLPAALALREDAALFAPDGGRANGMIGAAMLGSGFALRLAAAEVRAAGGVFGRSGARIGIDLPLASDQRQPPGAVSGSLG